MKKKQTKKYILQLVSSFFTNEPYTMKKSINKDEFLSFVSKTCMDGIIHHVIKNDNNVPKIVKETVKNRHKIMVDIDKLVNDAYEVLKKIPFDKILIKENVFKFTDSYVTGTRYSCDIDLLVDLSDIHKVDSFLTTNKNFYLRGIDYDISKEVIHNGYLINKDVSKYENFREKKLSLIAHANSGKESYNPINDIDSFENKITNTIKSLEDILSLYKKITENDFYINKDIKNIENDIKSEDIDNIENKKKIVAGEKIFIDNIKKKMKSLLSNTILEIHKVLNTIQKTSSETNEINELKEYADLILNNMSRMINRKIRIQELLEEKYKTLHYDYENGAFIDMHFELFPSSLPFNINKEDLKLEPISKYLYSLNIEDSIIVDACHFTSNLSKYKKPYAFQGFLKYQTDLFYKVKNNSIDWEKIINKAKETNSSSQVWFYLSIASKYLNMSIPKQVIRKVQKNGSVFQNIILLNINKYKLLFNQPNFFVKLYSKLYLKDGLLKNITDRAHGIYNKILR